MSTNKRLVTAAAAILLWASIVCAQTQNPASGARSTIPVTASATADRVRFTAPGSAMQIRLEVYGANGEKLFDNEIRGGNVIDWRLQDGHAEPLSDGAYLCVVTVKNLSGRLTQRIGSVIFEKGAAILRAMDVSQMTAQQTGAVGPIEESASVVVLNEDELQTPTVIAHNGEEGQITRGRGALSFRLGDFFSGKDTEQMRLTAEGNLGIGTSDPKLKLDVAGMIGARDGLMFSDGSTLTVNRKGVLTHTDGSGNVAPNVAGTGTQNQLAKWTDNSGTLGDSGITETASGIGIGTTTPQSGLDYRNALAPFFTRDIGTTNFGTTQSALQLGVTNAGSRNAGVGPAFLFFADNSAGAKSFLGRVSAAWENPAAGAEAGSIRFQVRANSADTTALTERMRITASGNVGIGTSSPNAKLDILGGADSDGSNDPQAMALQWRGGGFRHWVRTRHNSILGMGNAIDLFVNNSTSAGGSTGPGVGSTHVMTLDSGRVGIGTSNPLYNLHVRTGADQDLVVRPGADFSGSLTGIGIQSINDVNSVYKPLDLEGSQVTLNVGSGGNVGIGAPAPAEKLTVAGRVQSTSGGFKFPDGSVQTTAANPTYTTVSDTEVQLTTTVPNDSVLLHLNLPAGAYMLSATVQFSNTANFPFQDNSRLVLCKFSGEPGSGDASYRYEYYMFGLTRLTPSFHSVLNISSGGVDLLCRALSWQANVFANSRRLTAVRIEGNVVVQ